MPLERFRSFEQAKDALWGRLGEPGHLRRVAWLWAFSQRLRPAQPRPGVRRYHSIEEAQRER